MIKKQKKRIFFQRKRNILTKKCQPFQPFCGPAKKRRRMGFLHNLIDESCKGKSGAVLGPEDKIQEKPKKCVHGGNSVIQ